MDSIRIHELQNPVHPKTLNIFLLMHHLQLHVPEVSPPEKSIASLSLYYLLKFASDLLSCLLTAANTQNSSYSYDYYLHISKLSRKPQVWFLFKAIRLYENLLQLQAFSPW
jgi:hypothetical protein